MQFASLPFWFFFVVVLTLQWTIGRSRHTRNLILLLASYVFYAFISLEALSLLMLSTSINYLLAELMLSQSKKNQATWLYLGVGFNLGFLGLFKYLDFFRGSVESIALWMGLQLHLPIVQLLLPIGISFYTFQALAYLLDLYRGHGIRARSLLDFALFQAFFPQLLIGPICRSVDLIPQIQAEPSPEIANTTKAMVLILSGLFKKMVIATLLFENGSMDVLYEPQKYAALGLWAGMIAYSIQLYCDFSGYTDLARGVAILMGFELPDNFNRPYRTSNIGDFWQSWHITFSRWLRDYIYIPLGGSRCSSWKVALNLFLTFIFCGLWHGASWGFLLWGGAHGIALALHKLNRDRRRRLGLVPTGKPDGWEFWLGWLYTFSFVSISRVLFVAPSLDVAMLFFQRAVDIHSFGLGAKVTLLYGIFLGLIMNFYGKDFFENFCSLLQFQSTQIQMIVGISIFISIMLLRPGGVPPYLYFAF